MSSLTFSHLSSDTFEKESQKKAGRKRPRIREAVSCWPCRSRKIRCDREQPCRPCVERSAGPKCTYGHAKPPESHRASSSSTLAKHGEPTSPRAPVARDGGSTGSGSTRPSSVRSASGTRAHGFQGANRKTRFTSVSHWMAPCSEMKVMGALLAGSKEFQATLVEFSRLKERMRHANAVATNVATDSTDSTTGDGRQTTAVLFNALPTRSVCELWIGRFFKTYGRVYDLVDPATLASDVHQSFARPTSALHEHATAINSVYPLRILVTVAIGMQLSDADRLHGRRLGRLVEDYVHRASRIQKPCIGSVQVLLQLVLLKTITSSDTDAEHNGMAVLGLVNNIVLSMGLHRDPALFEGIPPYYAELRKRLWACYVRLHLAYCVRTGTPFPVRLDDCDCPLPTATVLQAPITETTIGSERIRACATAWSLSEQEARNDAHSGHALAALAHIVAPVYQTLCSTKPRVTPEMQKKLEDGFSAVMADLPPHLQSGATVADPMVELQRTMISTCMQSFLLIVCLGHLVRTPESTPETAPSPPASEDAAAEAFRAQRPQLLEIWDYAMSILKQFQNLCHETGTPSAGTISMSADAATTGHHLLWTDVGRAALGACLVVGRMRRQEADWSIPFSVRPQTHHTAAIFQQMLSQSLDDLLRLWRKRSHFGPVTAKTSLLLAVTSAVTSSLSSSHDVIFKAGVDAAARLMAEIKKDLGHARPPCSSTGSCPHAGRAAVPATVEPASTVKTGTGSLGMSDANDVMHMSSWTRPPSGFLDGGGQQMLELSASSSSASHAASPEFGGVGNGSDIFSMDVSADFGFPFSAYGPSTTCQFPDAENTFLDFPCDTLVNMF